MNDEIRVRFAPSPTGLLHLGGLRTAMFNYVYARKQKGKFILRIEDTDRSRFVPEAVDNIVNTLRETGLDFDEGPGMNGPHSPYYQSERLEIYRKHVHELIERGAAYPCFCSQKRIDDLREQQSAAKEPIKYDGLCRSIDPAEARKRIEAGEPHVIRLRMPDEGTFTFYDKVRGKVEILSTQIDDQVLVKSDGFPTYHLAATVDDHIMGITHVIRGEEWLSSTPKHIHLYESLGWKPPVWVHLPLILNTDRSKLSKRHGDFSVNAFLEKGFLSEALLNFVALLGWHPKGDEEIFDLERVIDEFSFKRINKAGAVFDLTKLDWMNGHYLRTLPLETIAQRAQPFFEESGIQPGDLQKYHKAIAIARNYASTLKDLPEQAAIFFQPPEFDEHDRELFSTESAQKVLAWWISQLTGISELGSDYLNGLVREGMQTLELKGKHYYFPLRLALYGKTKGPDIPALIDALGTDEARRRFVSALDQNNR